MKLKSDDNIFNLYDTNGRRNDILNAYKIYLKIIDDLKICSNNPWAAYPKSLNQYLFYKQAVNDSIGKFNIHPQFDAFERYLNSHPDFKEKFFSLDPSLDLNKVVYKNKTLKFILDIAIQSRARHYTSSLCNIGFVNDNREITPAGKALIDPSRINIDLLEKTLKLAPDNLLTLRQVLKVRVFNEKGNKYYSPGKFAFYLILKKYKDSNIYTITNFMKLVQLVSPTGNYTIDDIDKQLRTKGLKGGMSLLINSKKSNDNVKLIKATGNRQISKDNFYEIFTNGKSSQTTDIYFLFYTALSNFVLNRNNENYLRLIQLFDKNPESGALKKAFGSGKSIFKIQKKLSLKKFIFDNSSNEFLKCNTLSELNLVFYDCFTQSKVEDRLRENISETKYILESTGLFKTKTGIVSIRDIDLFDMANIISNLQSDILNSGSFEEYESTSTSPFGQMKSLVEILGISENEVKQQINIVTKKYNLDRAYTLGEYLERKKEQEFEEFVKKAFPKEKVFKLLDMFKDRNNDIKIQREVTEEADVPTIFEYICGLAWYYLSDDHYRLMKSFRLTFDANFLPLAHAAGGDGDLIIDYNDSVLMIEVTLMNKQAQKRGEWEPVLRHSVNLSIYSDKPARTLFVADELDNNTINIWRAVASVPLESSNQAGNYTDAVVKIMPLQIDDFISFNKNPSFSSRRLIKAIDNSYDPLANISFDTKWRDEIIKKSSK